MYLNDSHAFSTAHYIRYVIDTPMNSGEYDMVGLYDKWVLVACKASKTLVIQAPKGESLFYPKELKRHYKTFKRVMNLPGTPMKLYSLKIEHKEHSPEERWLV